MGVTCPGARVRLRLGRSYNSYAKRNGPSRLILKWNIRSPLDRVPWPRLLSASSSARSPSREAESNQGTKAQHQGFVITREAAIKNVISESLTRRFRLRCNNENIGAPAHPGLLDGSRGPGT